MNKEATYYNSLEEAHKYLDDLNFKYLGERLVEANDPPGMERYYINHDTKQYASIFYRYNINFKTQEVTGYQNKPRVTIHNLNNNE